MMMVAGTLAKVDRLLLRLIVTLNGTAWVRDTVKVVFWTPPWTVMFASEMLARRGRTTLVVAVLLAPLVFLAVIVATPLALLVALTSKEADL
jgi:phage terminase large subunit-like protein